MNGKRKKCVYAYLSESTSKIHKSSTDALQGELGVIMNYWTKIQRNKLCFSEGKTCFEPWSHLIITKCFYFACFCDTAVTGPTALYIIGKHLISPALWCLLMYDYVRLGWCTSGTHWEIEFLKRTVESSAKFVGYFFSIINHIKVI